MSQPSEVTQNWSHGNGAAEVGTKEWAEFVRLQLVSMVGHLGENEESFLGYVDLVKSNGAWSLMTTKEGEPFDSFEAFCAYKRPWGLGTPWDKIQPFLAAGIARVATATKLEISKIRTDGGTQSRAGIDDAVVAEYAESVELLPPVVVFHDGENYWLADGFHRLAAFVKVGRKSIGADVRQGDKRAAILFSVGANSTHGLRRTNADKRRAVELLLRDEAWKQWSNREIAKACGVGSRFVDGMKSEATAHGAQFPEKTIGADGRSRKQPERKPEPPPEEEPCGEPEPSDSEEMPELDFASAEDAVTPEDFDKEEPEEVEKPTPRPTAFAPIVGAAVQLVERMTGPEVLEFVRRIQPMIDAAESGAA